MDKPRVIKNYEKLDEETLLKIKLAYPYGFADSLIRFNDITGKKSSGLKFETDEKIYLVRMTEQEALLIIDDDDDFDEDGNLRDEAREEYHDRLEDDEDDNIEAADIDPSELIDEDTETEEEED